MGAETTGMIAAALSGRWSREQRHPILHNKKQELDVEDELTLTERGLSKRQQGRVFRKALDQARRKSTLWLNQFPFIQQLLKERLQGNTIKVQNTGMQA